MKVGDNVLWVSPGGEKFPARITKTIKAFSILRFKISVKNYRQYGLDKTISASRKNLETP